MYACEICNYKTGTLKLYILHYQLHQHIPNITYPCHIDNCSRRFSSYKTFKAHISRDHANTIKSFRPHEEDVLFMCEVVTCLKKCESWQKFVSHLKSHINTGLKVACPFKQCFNKFSVASSLTSHFSRKHRHWSLRDFKALCIHIYGGQNAVTNTDNINSETDSVSDGQMHELVGGGGTCSMDVDLLFDVSARDEGVTEKDISQTLSLFYLKMQSKLLLPVSSIQQIIEGYQDIYDKEQINLFNRLKHLLTDEGITDESIGNIIGELSSNDLIRNLNCGMLRSKQTRKSFYRKQFNFVDPVEIYLGRNALGKPRYMSYVPIRKSLEAFLSNKSVWDHVSSFTWASSHSEKEHILCDVVDGSICKRNDFLMLNPNAIGIILYQDAFEVVNPLGAGRKKHKILAVYYTIVNIPAYCRSLIDPLQLALLCREVDFKYFKQESIFSCLISDLKVLEESGIVVEKYNQSFKCTLLAIVGDNLGSHCVGGFTENFSRTPYMCRYCEIPREEFLQKPYVTGPVRTIEKYDQVVADLDGTNTICGVKANSVFNQLKNYHVCQPGLQPLYRS
ncbi:Uncharacterised protein r2_g2771 [Pycnogonum litorale]